jgi:hypothetical protein
MRYFVGNLSYVISVIGGYFGDLLIVAIFVIWLFIEWLIGKDSRSDL